MLVFNKTRNKCYWFGKEIAEDKYAEIKAMYQNPPAAQEGCRYHLTESLAWEEIPEETPDPDEELSAEEALDIIMGVRE